MNSLKLMIIGILFFVVSITKAQVTVNVNLGNPPEWGPVGYTEVRYYYLPDIEAYYDVETSVFIYFGNGVWIRDRFLPTRYRNYDLYGGYKVVMTDYRGNAPYHNFKEYKVKYKKGYRGPSQKTIGSKGKKGNSNPNNKKSSVKQQKSKGSGNNKPTLHKSSSSKNKGSNQSHGGGKGKK